MKRWVILAVLCWAAPGPAAWAQGPIIKSETRLVIVDVVVTGKKGAYVRDLTAKDFKLWDDNKEQPIESVTLASGGSIGGPDAASPQANYLVLALDNAGMDAGDQIRARQAAARFIDANAQPDRRMAVANFDGGLHILQGFTESAGRLKDALNGAKSAAVVVNNSTTGSGAAADLDTRQRFAALRTLASDLASVPGRKSIVLLTGALTVRSDQKGELAEVIAACNRANVALYPVDVRDAAVPTPPDAAPAPTRGRGGLMTPLSGNRPGGIPRNMNGDEDPETTADPGGANQQVIFALASGTGGFVIRNASELPHGMQQIGEEQQEYYLLGFTPSDSKEGSCHALRVKVDRGGLTLRARSSYCSNKADELIATSAPETDLAKRAAGAQQGNIAASLRLPFFYTADGAARVHVAMEIQPDAIKFEKRKNTLHADVNILGIASAADGSVAARFNDTLTLDFDEADQKWKEKPVHYEKQFKIAPGQYSLTVAFSAGGESFGKLTEPLAIEPHQAGELALSGLALGNEIRKEGAGDPALAATLFDDRTPLTINGTEMIPGGATTFAKSEPAYCYVEAYPGSGADRTLTFGLRILNAATGEVAWNGGTASVRVPESKTSVPFGVTVPVANLSPGSYRVEATVADASGQKAQRTAAFIIK